MNLAINIIGSHSTFEKVKAAFGEGPRRLHRGTELLGRAGIVPSVTYIEAVASEKDLAIAPDGLTIIVVDGGDSALLARLSHLRKKAGLTVPVIGIASSEANLQSMAQHSRGVADWLFPDFSPAELAFRLLALATGCQRSVHRLPCGEITLERERRAISLNGRSVRLSPTEVALAEFFLTRSSRVISLAELVAFFKESGKSSAMNNIRVAIYQLRLKLEELSNFRLTLVTLYRQGYSLRQARPAPASLAA